MKFIYVFVAFCSCVPCFAQDTPVASDRGLDNSVEQSFNDHVHHQKSKYSENQIETTDEFDNIVQDEEQREVIINEDEKVDHEGEATDNTMEEDYHLFEFPPLHRVDPGTVGNKVRVKLEDGSGFTRITRATQPPVFGRRPNINTCKTDLSN